MNGEIKKEVKVMEKYKRQITIELKGKEFPIELDVTPHRKKDEDFETYKERQKYNTHFQRLAKKNYKFKSLTHLDKLLGKKGESFINNALND